MEETGPQAAKEFLKCTHGKMTILDASTSFFRSVSCFTLVHFMPCMNKTTGIAGIVALHGRLLICNFYFEVSLFIY